MKELEHVTAAILAGGLGTRLRSVVADRPKVLAEVKGRPFVEYLLDQLCVAGVKRVVLCTGYMGDQVEQLLGARYRSLELLYSREPSPLGTGGALRLALPMLTTESILVMNGDSYCDAQLDAFAIWHTARSAIATILLAEMEDTRRYGRVQTDDEGRLTRFEEKATAIGSGWVNAGTYLLHRDLIETIPSNRVVSIERQVFPVWIGRGLHGYRSEGRLMDIGIPDAYRQANTEFAGGLL
jgi:NDP-sugar pyrophosphorylase family protein